MDLGMQLLLLIVFGLMGFGMSKVWGINPSRVVSDTGAALLIVALVSFVNPYETSPTVVANNIGNMVKFLVDALPSLVIGDAAGTIVSEITGER